MLHLNLPLKDAPLKKINMLNKNIIKNSKYYFFQSIVLKFQYCCFNLMEILFLIDCKTTAATSATAAQNQSTAAANSGQCILLLSSDYT